MSFCKDCITGVTHEGTEEGKFEQIGGVKCYVAIPTIDYPKNKVLLHLPDVFGYDLINSRLLADDYARNGFKTIIPNLLLDDAIAPDAMNSGNFDFQAWFVNHTPEKTRPVLDKVIAALKAEGITDFCAVGFCFGARYVFDLAFENIIGVAAVAHPSLLQVPADLERYKAESNAPLLINSCTTDTQFPHESQELADKILGNGQFGPGYKREYWNGCTHGFAVRGDMSDPLVKAGKEGAFKASVEWLARL